MNMTPGEFVKMVAQVLRLPEVTTSGYDKNLRVGGFRSKSGRGSGAARVTPRDAAHLLVAILGSAQVKDAVRTVERYGEAQPDPSTSSERLFRDLGLSELTALPANHNFIDAVEALIVSASTGSLSMHLAEEAKQARGQKLAVAPMIEVAAHTPGTLGSIRVAGIKTGRKVTTAEVRYALPGPWSRRHGSKMPPKHELDAWEASVRSHRIEGLDQYRRITEPMLLRIAEAFTADPEKA